MKSHLCRRIVCVADARSPRGEVEECQVPKVGARCEAVPGQLLVPGGPGERLRAMLYLLVGEGSSPEQEGEQ